MSIKSLAFQKLLDLVLPMVITWVLETVDETVDKNQKAFVESIHAVLPDELKAYITVEELNEVVDKQQLVLESLAKLAEKGNQA